jgi:hypothetical protein
MTRWGWFLLTVIAFVLVLRVSYDHWRPVARAAYVRFWTAAAKAEGIDLPPPDRFLSTQEREAKRIPKSQRRTL